MRHWATQRRKWHYALILACAAGITPANAATFDWQGGAASNDIDLPGNWQGNAAPPNDGSAVLRFSAANFTTSVQYVFPNVSPAYSINQLNFQGTVGFDLTNSGGAAITLGSGGIDAFASASQLINAPVIVGHDQTWDYLNSATALKFTGGVNTNGHTVTVSANGLPGTNEIDGAISGSGGLIFSGDGSLILKSVNTYTGDTEITLESVQLNSGGSINGSDLVDVANGGVLNVAAGAFVSSSTISVEGGGTLNINGGAVSSLSGGDLDMTSGTGAAVLTFTAGTLNPVNVLIGNIANSTAALVQSGGIFTPHLLLIGEQAKTQVTYTLSGAGVLTAPNPVIADLGTTSFLQTGGTLNADNLTLAQQAGSSGTFTFSGGTLNAGAIAGGTGKSVFHFNGGILIATGTNTAFFQNLNTADIQIGGATINTNGFNVTIPQDLDHGSTPGNEPDGGLTKTGAGTLTLTGPDTYTGPTNVSTGTVSLTSTASLATSTINVQSGGTFILNGGSVNTGAAGEVQLSTVGGTAANFTLSSGSLNSSETVVGSGGTGTSSFIQSGGTLTSTQLALSVGSSSFSIDTLGGSAMATTSETDVGYYGTATFTQSNNSQHYVAGPLILGVNAHASGTYTFGDTTSLDTEQTTIGMDGTGVFLQNGGIYTDTGSLTLAQNAGSSGVFTLSGGDLFAHIIRGGAGTSTFNFDGGILFPTTSSSAYFQGLTNANVQGGGATIDASVTNITIAQSLLHDTTPGAAALDGGLSKSDTGTLTLTGSNTYTGGTNVPQGSLVIGAPHALPNGAVSIGDGIDAANLTLLNNVGPVTLSALQITANALLDVGNNKVVVNYAAPATDPAKAISAALLSGYHGGVWSGQGINSTTAAANPTKFAVGYLDGNHPGDNTAGSVAPNQIIIKYTLSGDAFLENSVGFDDLVVVAQNYGNTGNDWAGGNFNYDPTGVVGFADLVVVAQNFGFSSGVNQGDSAAGLSAAWQVTTAQSVVPEPASFVLLAGGALWAATRRRKSDGSSGDSRR